MRAPNIFISPKLWNTHSIVLRNIVLDFDYDKRVNLPVDLRQKVDTYQAQMTAMFEEVHARNEALLFRTAQNTSSKGCLRSMVADVQVSLNGTLLVQYVIDYLMVTHSC